MPKDSLPLREALLACLPNLNIERPLAESGQRVVYLAYGWRVRRSELL